jgi:type II secretory pathway pseudopilin PulG
VQFALSALTACAAGRTAFKRKGQPARGNRHHRLQRKATEMRKVGAAISRKLGLTLIEIVVVLCIIVVLMGITLSVYTGVLRWTKHQVNGAVETRN